VIFSTWFAGAESTSPLNCENVAADGVNWYCAALMTPGGFKARAPNRAEQTAMDTGKRHLPALDSLCGISAILIFADYFIHPKYHILFG
jgi:hypothetical protein